MSPVLLRARLETSIVIGVLQFGFFFCVAGFKVFHETNKLKPFQKVFGPDADDIGCFSLVMLCITSTFGVVVYYFMPRARELYPWGLFKAPFLRNSEWRRFEATAKSGRVLWFEKLTLFANNLERNVIYPLAILNETWLAFYTKDYFIGWPPVLKCLVLGLTMSKLLRHCFRSTHHQWIVFLCSHLLKYDLQAREYHEPILITWFLGNIVYTKVLGFRQRFGFILVQLNPGTTWGSAFHAVAQPFALPHSGWLFVQTLFSTLTSAPLKPIGGSTIFMTSYVRPFRFWEKNYNTKLNENTRLQSQLEYYRKRDENSAKNALFYENLAFSLKQNLAGDIQMGRYGNVREGDVFILASSSTSDSQQNGLIQIVEIGNGIVSFQFRGLEFKGQAYYIILFTIFCYLAKILFCVSQCKGTYCQQREVEAITEDATQVNCVCCWGRSLADMAGCSGRNPMCLSFASWFRNMAMTWKVLQKNYVLDGYSICDSSAGNLFSMFDYRKQVITYFVKCIIYYTVKRKQQGNNFDEIIKALKKMGR